MNHARRSVLPALVLALGAACHGCAPAPSPPDASTDAPVTGDAFVISDGPITDPLLDVGTGQSEWEPIADGDHVELIHGPQGGYHVFARIREQRLGGDVEVTFRVTPADGGAPVNDPTDRIRLIEGRGLVRTAQGWESSSALLVILVRITGPTDVVGRRFVLEADVAPTGSITPTPVSRSIVIVDKT